MTEIPPKRIAIIGAGPVGLTSAKACLEEGLEPVVLERSEGLGGLWRFHENIEDGLPSVMATTIINSSKELSAFSDFPPPSDFPNFMHHSMMLQYFHKYAERFNLKSYIRYKQEVLQITKANDYAATGRWLVKVRDLNSNTESVSTFDGVMVCTGHHSHPNRVKFRNVDKFKGRIRHTHEIKRCDDLRGKRVAIIGVGNSGADVSIDASFNADKVYLSTRRGTWVAPRVAPDGMPLDTIIQRKYYQFFLNYFPLSIVNMMCEYNADIRFNHRLFGLMPTHGYLCAHPTINDALANRIASGTIAIKGDVQEYTENGIIFKGDGEETKVEEVILATGYHIKYPMLPDVDFSDNSACLYKFVFPPDLPHATLGILGLLQPIGSLFPLAELQARWCVQVFKGHVKLPNKEKMLREIRDKQRAIRKRYVNSPRHTIQVDFMNYCEEIAKEFGAKPNRFRMFFSDPFLWFKLTFGPMVSYQYRLEGPHSWGPARHTIMTVWDRVIAPLQTRRDIDHDVVSQSRYVRFERFVKRTLWCLLFAFLGIPLIACLCTCFDTT